MKCFLVHLKLGWVRVLLGASVLGLTLAAYLAIPRVVSVSAPTSIRPDVSTETESPAPHLTPAHSASRPLSTSPLPPRAPHPLLLVGVDGLDLRVLRTLVRRGRCPNLARLMREGAHGVLLSEREMRSPALWTTIVTGRPHSAHGIYDFVTGSSIWPKRLRSAEQKLVTSDMRQVPALWNMVSEHGLKVAVVGMLNTWPAEEVNGTMVAPYVAYRKRKQSTIKGTVYADEADQVWPPHRWEKLKPLVVSPRSVPDRIVARFIKKPPAGVVEQIPLLKRYHYSLHWSLSHTLTMAGITKHLMRETMPDLTMVYFEGCDSLGHRFWLFRQSRQAVERRLEDAGYTAKLAGELVRSYGRVVDAYYRFVDRVLGELTALLPEDGRMLVVSDHGFGGWRRFHPPPEVSPFTGEHRLEGTLIARGPGIRPGTVVHGATIYDVAPTVLDLLGVGVPESLVGKVLREMFANTHGGEEQTAEAPAQPLRPRDSATERLSRDVSEQVIERLRSLGYVQ